MHRSSAGLSAAKSQSRSDPKTQARPVGRRQLGQLAQRRRRAPMGGEKAEKLRDVARVGLHGLSRHAPLGAEIAQPARDFSLHIGGEQLSVMGAEVAGASFTLP